MMNCARDACGHPSQLHANRPGDTSCRVNGCSCRAFADPEPGEAPERGPRRVAIDVPDGYIVSISLIPAREEPDGSED